MSIHRCPLFWCVLFFWCVVDLCGCEAPDKPASPHSDSAPPSSSVDSGGPTDADADGAIVPEDCDDTDASVFPGAREVCDGKDNNCDGVTDNNPTDGERSWPDADGDSVGEMGPGEVICPGPAYLSWVTTTGDCDDTLQHVYPGAPEHCDGIDEDCDGEVDEDPVDPPTWYADLDGDGAGAGAEVVACDAPEGHVRIAGDCDDSDPLHRPGLPEVCGPGQGVDDDCDGLVDCEDSECDAEAACEETDCADGADSDLDGATDCFDDDCWGTPECFASEIEILGGSVVYQHHESSLRVSSWTVESMSGVATRAPIHGGSSSSTCTFTVHRAFASASSVSRALTLRSRSGSVSSGCVFSPLATLPPALGHNQVGSTQPLGWGIWRPSTAPWTLSGTFSSSAGVSRPMYSQRVLTGSRTHSGGTLQRTYRLGGSVVGFPPETSSVAYHRWW